MTTTNNIATTGTRPDRTAGTRSTTGSTLQYWVEKVALSNDQKTDDIFCRGTKTNARPLYFLVNKVAQELRSDETIEWIEKPERSLCSLFIGFGLLVLGIILLLSRNSIGATTSTTGTSSLLFIFCDWTVIIFGFTMFVVEIVRQMYLDRIYVITNQRTFLIKIVSSSSRHNEHDFFVKSYEPDEIKDIVMTINKVSFNNGTTTGSTTTTTTTCIGTCSNNNLVHYEFIQNPDIAATMLQRLVDKVNIEESP
jgi:hypothetical protein